MNACHYLRRYVIDSIDRNRFRCLACILLLVSPDVSGYGQSEFGDDQVAEILPWSILDWPDVVWRSTFIQARVARARKVGERDTNEVQLDADGRLLRASRAGQIEVVKRSYEREYDTRGRLLRITETTTRTVRGRTIPYDESVRAMNLEYDADDRLISGECQGCGFQKTVSIERNKALDSLIVIVVDYDGWASVPWYSGEQWRLGVDARGRLVYDSLAMASKWLFWRCIGNGYKTVYCYDTLGRKVSERSGEMAIEFPGQAPIGEVLKYITAGDTSTVSEYWCTPVRGGGDWLDPFACPCAGIVASTPFQSYSVDEHGLPLRGHGWTVEYEFYK